ncbi:MAG TPA: Gfo/Idh/MocA family oxidoreductase [Saprospiraceae bacterium]|nr:Gfo/Idh/MocA family oxidoreductase [Saprospiraceae bacterium]
MSSSRRHFLRQSGITAIGLSMTNPFPNILIPRTKEKLGVALIGLGYYSTDLLAPALRETKHCYLAGIVTGTPGKIPVWQQRYQIPDKNVYNYSNMDRIADNPDIDVIYVVLPPSMHSAYCIRAAKAGKHVWCEKPMAMTVAECEEAINACKSNNVSLAIGYRMQHEVNTQTIIAYGRNKTYGKVQHVEASAGYHDGRVDHWKQKKVMGGGAMYDMGVYPLNAARYTTGEEPLAVSAQASTDRPKIYHEVEEHINFELRFPSGATATCEASFGHGLNSLLVTCASGSYNLVPFQSYSGIRGRTSDGKMLNASPLNQQAKQMDDDALAIKEGRPLVVPGEEGLRDIRVVEAIYRSAGMEGKWIDM